MSKIWAMVSGDNLADEVRYALDVLVGVTKNVQVLEGGLRAGEFVETLRMDVQGMAEELRETLTVNADLLGEIVLVDMNAPAPMFGDVPEAEKLSESDG